MAFIDGTVVNVALPALQTNLNATAADVHVTVVANQQVSNEFGTQRYALLFEPGTYGSAADPLNFQIGYYTSVAGLGRSPAAGTAASAACHCASASAARPCSV